MKCCLVAVLGILNSEHSIYRKVLRYKKTLGMVRSYAGVDQHQQDRMGVIK